jgi:hypothetical protein
VIISFKPVDLPGVIAGDHDTAIKNWFNLIPNGTHVCAYHEANLTTNFFQGAVDHGITIKDGGGNSTQFQQVQHKMLALKNASNSTLKIGQILLVGSQTNPNSPWIVPAPTLDWYGMDSYAGNSGKTAAECFGNAIAAFKSVAGSSVSMAICETHGSTLGTSEWNQFFTDGFNLAVTNSMYAYCTWWGGSSTSSPPTFDPHGSYVPTLQGLGAET